MPIESWTCPKCGSTNSKKRAKGLCRKCYLAQLHKLPKHQEANRLSSTRYRQSTEGKIIRAQYFRSPQGKAAVARYQQSPDGKAVLLRYHQSVEGRTSHAAAAARCRAARTTAKGTLTIGEWRDILARANGRCYWCKKRAGASNLTMDHVIPLKKNGRHSADNIVAACALCNSRKHDKMWSLL